MSITVRDPNTILLSGDPVPVCTYPASEAITPGQLVEFFSDSGTMKVKKCASATDIQRPFVALQQDEWNLGVDTAYGVGDLVKVAMLHTGHTFWGLIPSGANIAIGDYLQSNGDGNLKEATATTASANVAKYQALDAPGAVTALSRVRVQVL